jgi:hypothetical protein
MSSLYASIETDGRAKTTATRQGHRYMSAHVRGWHEGCEVQAFHDKETDRVTIFVYRTGGSNDYAPRRPVASWSEGDESISTS